MFKFNCRLVKVDKPKAAVWAAALLLFTPMLAYALGLGDAQIISRLNEPLNIELEILGSEPKTLLNVVPHLADLQEFERAGIDRPEYLNTLQFKVEDQVIGNPIIRLSTQEPIREPVINVLIELLLPSGRLVKSYTFLLDPPEKERLTYVPTFQNSVQKLIQNKNQDTKSKQEEINKTLQTRLEKIEQQFVQATTSLKEENNNLHELVQIKQKEIDTFREGHEILKQPVVTQEQEPITVMQKKSELSSFNQGAILNPAPISKIATVKNSQFTWLFWGVALVVLMSAFISVREFFRRKKIGGSFGKSSKTDALFMNLQNSESFKKQNNQEAFQAAISQVNILEEKLHQSTEIEEQPNTNESFILNKLEDVEIYIKFSKFMLAEETILKVIEHYPDNTKAWLRLMEVLLAEEKFLEMEEKFKMLPARFSQDYPNEYLAYQKRFKIHDDIEEKLEVLEEPVAHVKESLVKTKERPSEKDFDFFKTKLDFAKVYLEMKDLESARDLLNEIIQSGPENLQTEAQELLKKVN